ncbi:hypothetical protein ACQKWADRAFT_295084 [Trichoderma austrokoningii]
MLHVYRNLFLLLAQHSILFFALIIATRGINSQWPCIIRGSLPLTSNTPKVNGAPSGKRHEDMERRCAIALPLTGKRASLVSSSGI